MRGNDQYAGPLYIFYSTNFSFTETFHLNAKLKIYPQKWRGKEKKNYLSLQYLWLYYRIGMYICINIQHSTEEEKKEIVNHFLLNPKSIPIKTLSNKFLRFRLTVLLQIEFLCRCSTLVSEYLHYASVYLYVYVYLT